MTLSPIKQKLGTSKRFGDILDYVCTQCRRSVVTRKILWLIPRLYSLSSSKYHKRKITLLAPFIGLHFQTSATQKSTQYCFAHSELRSRIILIPRSSVGNKFWKWILKSNCAQNWLAEQVKMIWRQNWACDALMLDETVFGETKPTGRHLGLLMRAMYPITLTHRHFVLSPVSLASRDQDGDPSSSISCGKIGNWEQSMNLHYPTFLKASVTDVERSTLYRRKAGS